MKKQNIRITLMSAAVCIVTGASAVPSVTIDSVSQRWPWNNKIDITYTISGGTDLVNAARNGGYTRIVFTATIGGTPYTIDGSHDVIAKTCTGTHIVTWTNAPAGVKATGCTMGADIYTTTGDYMIIDLNTGAYAFEDMRATQADSDARYNNALCKTDRLVLRRVPRWSDRATLPNAASLPSEGYPTGDDTNYLDTNSRTNWVTDRDYFIAVFPTTRAQWTKFFSTDPAKAASAGLDSTPEQRPVETVSFALVRSGGAVRQNPVSDHNYTFCEKIRRRCDLVGFDLPTELMWEIAARAGGTGTYIWDGTSSDAGTYAILGKNGTAAVGLRLPNAWGLFDMIGNVSEKLLDDASRSNLATAPDPWTPAYDSSNTSLRHRGSRYGKSTGDAFNQASHRGDNTSSGYSDKFFGFRLSWMARAAE